MAAETSRPGGGVSLSAAYVNNRDGGEPRLLRPGLIYGMANSAGLDGGDPKVGQHGAYCTGLPSLLHHLYGNCKREDLRRRELKKASEDREIMWRARTHHP